jgi:hypothetical protein
MPLALAPPVFGNLLCGFVEPIFVGCQPNYLDGGKPFGRVRGGIAKRRQLADGHQNLNVMLREAEQPRRRRDIRAGW